jgi:hypothetical protein
LVAVKSFSALVATAIVILGFGAGLSLGASKALPAIVSSPSEIGAAVVGQRLTGEQGTWSGSSLTYTYQWHRCDPTGAACTSITGATALSYKLVAKDVGQTIGLTVTATDSTGTTSGYANLVGPIAAASSPLVSTIQPAITGAANQALRVSEGLWSPTPTAVSYAWQRCTAGGRACVPIPNATTNSYSAGADDIGHALVVLVTAASGTTTASAFSTRGSGRRRHDHGDQHDDDVDSDDHDHDHDHGHR